MNRFPVCFQHDSMLCGITCLQMNCKYFGREYSLDSLSKLCFATTEGVSMLFLGIGLLLKERRLLEKLFATGAGHEDWLNNLSLRSGLGLILTGTALRVATQLIRIPNRVISTQGKEQYIFAIGLIFCAVATLQVLYLIIRLAIGTGKKSKQGSADTNP